MKDARLMLAALALGTMSASIGNAGSAARRCADTFDKVRFHLPRSLRIKRKTPPAGTKLARMAAEGRIGIRKGW